MIKGISKRVITNAGRNDRINGMYSLYVDVSSACILLYLKLLAKIKSIIQVLKIDTNIGIYVRKPTSNIIFFIKVYVLEKIKKFSSFSFLLLFLPTEKLSHQPHEAL